MEGIVLQDRHIASYAVAGLLLALVAELTTAVGLARMWEAFVEGIGWETRIFPPLAEAQAWIRTRAKAKFKVDIAQFPVKN